MNSKASNPADFLEANKLLLMALGLVVIYHGALLPFTVGNSYDAYIHMFFGDSYSRAWFDPWEPRWYTGFTTTSYPPGTHMSMGLISSIFGLIGAFIVVMLLGLCTFVLGVYRFSLLFVNNRAAGFAALFSVISTSVVETVHLFGQLPTIFSLGLFLNGLPHVYRWLVSGKVSELFLALAMAGATTAAHHVTTIFGTILFIGPVALYAWINHARLYPVSEATKAIGFIRRSLHVCRPLLRGLVLGVSLLGTIILVVFPYWYWSVTDPITQVSIPHGSRESFIERLDLGLVFFVIPWGIQLFVFPYVVYKAVTSRMWPLAVMVIFCFVLGTGGTTPIPKLLLGPAFDILTLDRFTFWASVLILPFTGLFLDSLLNGQFKEFLTRRFSSRIHASVVISMSIFAVAASVVTATLSTMRPTQPDAIDPAPIVKFMAEDQHDRWRYLTLGFGDQFAFISAQMTARSVDGNYHSARRLPELISYAVERLENSKYLGVGGLGSLQQFLINSDRYHLKFIFSNDEFYDPLLHFSGWNRLLRLSNGIVVWEKPDVAPLPTIEPRRNFPVAHRVMWGLLPPIALFLGYSCIFLTSLRRVQYGSEGMLRDVAQSKTLSNRDGTILVVAGLGFAILVISVLIYATSDYFRKAIEEPTPEQVLERYYTHLDFVQFEDAFELIDQTGNVDLETYMLNRRWVGGILASYAKLVEFKAKPIKVSEASQDWVVETKYLTPFRTIKSSFNHRLLKRADGWRITFEDIRGYKPTERLQSEPGVSWNRPGRRSPTKADVQQDILDRPIVSIQDARLIERDGRYHLIGLLRNEDADPAAVKSTGYLVNADGQKLMNQQAGVPTTHRLLPGQNGFFNIAFEGVLSIEDAKKWDAFDPKLYIPPELQSKPKSAELSVQAVVNEQNHYTGISMSSIKTDLEAVGGPAVSVLLTNVGTDQVEIAQMQYALFDENRRVVHVDSVFLERDLKPGQSRRLKFNLPSASATTVLHDLADDEMMTNKRAGRAIQGQIDPSYLPGYVPLDGATGYTGIAMNVSTMNFDPLF